MSNSSQKPTIGTHSFPVVPETGVCTVHSVLLNSLRNQRTRECCVCAWKRNRLSMVSSSGAKQKTSKGRKTKHALDSVESSLSLPSRQASTKKRDIRTAKGGLWRQASDLTGWQFRNWQAEGLEGMEEGLVLTAIPKTSYFQSEQIVLSLQAVFKGEFFDVFLSRAKWLLPSRGTVGLRKHLSCLT